MGAKISKRYSSYKSQLKAFKLFLNFLPNGPHKTLKTTFGVFENWSFNIFFSFSLTWEPMGAKTSKRYSSIKSLLNPFEPFLNFLLSGSHKGTVLDFWNFEIPIFNEFFNFIIVPYGEIKKKKPIIWKTSDLGAKRSEIWASGVSIQCRKGTLDTLVIKVILGPFGAFWFSTSLYLENSCS